MNTHEEPDPSEFYVIREQYSYCSSNVLALKKEGLILDLNPESFSRSKSIAVAKKPTLYQFMTYDLGSDESTGFRLIRFNRRVSVEHSLSEFRI